MIKIIPPHAWPSLYENMPQVEEIKVASTGLRGADLAELVKRASHPLATWVRHNPPKPGEVYVHSVALGSTEKVGCFFAGAPVETLTGIKFIEDVKVGDLVLTHKGRYRPVTETFQSQYTGSRVTINVSGMPQPIVCTAEHPIFTIKAKAFGPNARCEAYLVRKGKTKISAIDDAIATKGKFVRADTLGKGDYLAIPIRLRVDGNTEIKHDPYALGVYVAEGCVSREYRDIPTKGKLRRVIYTMSKVDDQGMIDKIATAFPHNKLDKQPSLTSDKGIRVTVGNNSFAEECFTLFGGQSVTKRIPPAVFTQSREWRLQFLAGYLDGDGCITKNSTTERCNGVVTASTASVNLALDLQRLMAGLGIPSAITQSWNLASNGCFGSGDHVIYQVCIGSAYSPLAVEYCQRLNADGIPQRKRQAAGQIGSEYMLVPITSVATDTVVDTTKYNLEVDEDHTYNVQVVVHNCNRNADGYSNEMLKRDHVTFEKGARWYYNHKNTDPAKSYGVCKKAIHLPDIGRVDVISALNSNKEAADRNGGLVATKTLNKLASGDDVAVSQSCKIPFDVCMSCGNKAKHRGEYCTAAMGCKYGGCRSNLGRVFDDGFHLYVDNPHCNFFDLSDVSDTRGADRTAFVTGKVAGAYMPGGAELAERLGLVVPDHLLEPVTLQAVRCLRKLAAAPIGNYPSAPTWDDCVAIRYKRAAYTRNVMPTFPANDYDRQEMVSDMASAGVILPPNVWLSYMTGVSADKCAGAFVGGLDPSRDLLDRADFQEIVTDAIGPRSENSTVGMHKWSWLVPTSKSHAEESALGVLVGLPVMKLASTNPQLSSEAKARYLGYVGKTLAVHENSANFPLLISEFQRFNRNIG